LPQIQLNAAGTATNYQVPVIFSDYQYAIYLYPTQATNNPSSAQLVFEAQQTSSSGAGSPWGGNTAATATKITYPITTNQIYNVVTVLDGNSGFVTGELRLYINGSRVGTVDGVGAIYQNPNDPPGFGQGYVTSYGAYAKTINPELVTTTTLLDEPFNGVIDEFAYINEGSLSDARVAQLYAFSQTNWAANGFTVVTNGLSSTAPTLNFTAPSSGAFSLSWPVSATGYYLEYTTNLASGIWISNSIPPATVNGYNVVTPVIDAADSKFFRLAQ
jgi:hypothetical protein